MIYSFFYFFVFKFQRIYCIIIIVRRVEVVMRFKRIYIEITNCCNLACPFCIKNSREPKMLSFDEFKFILNKIKPYTNYLYFHVLGEPLLHPNINEFIDYASSNNFKVNITTNGYLINKIKNNNNIRQLNISLHSFDNNGKLSLIDYLKNIFDVAENLAKKGTKISFRLWVDNKINNQILDKINEYFGANIILNNFLGNITIKENIFLSISKPFIWPSLNNDFYNEKGTCYGLKQHISILSDGTVIPCCLDTKGNINLGNIYNDELNDILNSKRVQNIINGFNNNLKTEELCKRCSFIDK